MYANRCRNAPVQNLHRLTGTSVSRSLFRARGCRPGLDGKPPWRGAREWAEFREAARMNAIMSDRLGTIFRPGLAILLMLVFWLSSGCALFRSDEEAAGRQPVAGSLPHRELGIEEYLDSLKAGKVSHERDVKPILDSRCVACHGCYDAPCQLKLESPVALERGASKGVIFDGGRLEPMAPTRMGVDATTTAEWRGKGFYPVLDESADAARNPVLDRSVLARMLLLKEAHPLPKQGPLSDDFDFALNRSLQCPRGDEFAEFADRHPDWGMPYGLPGLKPAEHGILIDWLRQGARYPEPGPLPAETRKAVENWEDFMNGASLKERLVARYLYEHLFMGHLHFAGHDPREFFRLVRSRTPSGQPIREIPTLRPYDDPGRSFFYRLKPFRQTIVDKNHDVYEIGEIRIRRLRHLFLEPDYPVRQWPGYQPGLAANPFQVFAAIPPRSRYRFLLDDAYYFISGFMKGPVCRGQVALNVIRDQFWVTFYDPDQDRISNDAAFLRSGANWLRLPTEKGDAVGIEDLTVTYDEAQQCYLKAKNDFLAGLPDNQRNRVDALWDGDGANPNAALTAFRHFDSASLACGFVGARPDTVWLIDYPLFERIHYLLVAGFNVFGAVTHQAATRLYMDNLRMEAENNFLSFFPASARPAIFHRWNRGLLAEIKTALVNPYYGYGKDSGISFKSSDYAGELYGQILVRLGERACPAKTLYRCDRAPCDRVGATPLEIRAERALKPLTFLRGGGIRYLPELSFIRVHEDGAPPDQGAAYSLAQNKALENVSFMLWEQARRLPEEDTLTIAPGFLGSYPNFFFDVDIDRLPDFVSRILNQTGEQDFTALVEAYGVRRTRPDFWELADFFNRLHARQDPVTAGLFDLNRYENP